MTISYNLDVSTSHPWTIMSLLFRWKGSVWKATCIQYACWLFLFSSVSMVYRHLLDENQKETFADIARYFNSRLSYIPMDLILGFFVTAICTRFFVIYRIIGFMDNIALFTSIYVRGTSKRAIYFRRGIIRFVQINQVLVFRDLSMRARKRFPTLDTVVAAGFMTEHEKERFDEIQYRYSKYWLPIQWALATAYKARREGYIESDLYTQFLSEEIKEFRTNIAWLCNYDWVPLPLIYPTIVCLLVHAYFFVCVFGRQFTPPHDRIDLVFPFMTSVQFILYMGWLKVGEQLLNPWGEDDDDFETNMLVDRNLAMGLKIVDEGYGRTPKLMRDQFWDSQWEPTMSMANLDIEPEGSTLHDVKLPSSTSMVRMVPQASSANLERTASRSRLVPVKPEETRRQSSFDILREAVRGRGSRRSSVIRKVTSSSNVVDSESACSSRRVSTLADVINMAMKANRTDTEIALDKLATLESGDEKSPARSEEGEENEEERDVELTRSIEVLRRPDSLMDGDNEEVDEDQRAKIKEPLATCDF